MSCFFLHAAAIAHPPAARDDGDPADREFDLAEALGCDFVAREWTWRGLPDERQAVESALIAAHARRCCVLVDPDGVVRTREGRRRGYAQRRTAMGE